MRCIHCGQEIESDAKHCMYCGTKQNPIPPVAPVQEPAPAAVEPEAVPAEPVVQQTYQAPAAQKPVAPACEPVYVPPVAPAVTATRPQGTRPLLQLATNRGLVKMFFLGLVTLGIYNVVIFTKMVTDLNIVASRNDGRRTMPYFAMIFLTPLTLGILPWVWIHNMCDRIGNELRRRDINYKFGAASFWLWNILGSLILVGPFIYTHKLMKAMNLLCEDFNQNG